MGWMILLLLSHTAEEGGGSTSKSTRGTRMMGVMGWIMRRRA